MQKKTVPAKFLFSLRKLSLNVNTTMDVMIRIKRNQKFSYSKTYRYDPTTSLTLDEVLELKTTIDMTSQGFQSKTLTLQVNGRNPENKQEKFQMTATIQLSEIAQAGTINKTFRVKNKTDSGSLSIECRAELVDNQALTKHQSSTSLQPRDRQSPKQSSIQKVRSMQNIPRKKQKNLVISDKTSVNEFDPDSPPGPKSKGGKQFVSKSSRELGTVIQQNQGQSAISDKKSIALISQDNKSFKSKTQSQYITNVNNLNNQTTKMRNELKTIKSQLDDYRDRDTKNKRKIKQLQQKIELFSITQQKGQHGSQQIIKRLHEQIQSKVKQIRIANQESDKAIKLRRKEQETNAALRKQLGQLKLQKQKMIFEYKYASKKEPPTKDIQNNNHQDIESLKQYYQQQIQQLKQQIQQKTKLLTRVQLSPLNMNQNQCFSKQCQQSKKQHQKQTKRLHKRIQQLTNKLQTKDKLLSNYDQIQDQRKNEYDKVGVHKQFQKWKAQRLVLQHQIQLLRSNSNSNFNNNKQLSNIQQQLVTYKVQRESMNKQLQGLRKNLGVISKQREKLDEKYLSIQRQLIDQKQKLIHLLNAVQEIGGMQMFDEISKFIE